MQLSIIFIWGIIALTFILSGWFFWRQSSKSISRFQVTERPLAKQGRVEILGADIDKPLKDFADNFNNYIGDYNQKSKEQNRVQAIGYWVASLTAIISLFLSLGG
jgi:predicted PurR-regulated permease PerM